MTATLQSNQSSEATYQGFTYEQLAKDYSYDPVAGKITSTYSGIGLSSATGSMNKRAGPRGSIRLQMNILAMILHQGKIIEGQEVKLVDKDKSNLKLSNLLVVDPEDEVVTNIYCKNTSKEGIVENIYRGCFVVRGNEYDAVYFTKTLEEAIAVRESFELTGILAKHEESPMWPLWVLQGNLSGKATVNGRRNHTVINM
jgi:hypothetical protein